MHYRKHIFCCVNERMPKHPRSCCSARGSVELRGYMKLRAAQMGLKDIRINNAGCLERCELGPTMVIYPEGVWYHYQTKDDIDEILQTHLIEDRPVDRLLLADGQKYPGPLRFTQQQLTTTKIDWLSDDTMQVEFQHITDQSLPTFTAGTRISIQTTGERPLRQSYSLINSPAERHRYVIGVLSSGHGASGWLHKKLKVGDTISATLLENNFEFDESAMKHVLIADDAGIAPMLSLCHRLKEIDATFECHFCVSLKENSPFLKMAEKIAGDQLTVYASNAIPLDTLLQFHQAGDHLYLAGTSDLIREGRKHASHWPQESVCWESGYDRQLNSLPNHAFEIQLARQQRTIPVRADQTILEALQEHGVTTEIACENELCGACQTKVIHGQVEHRNFEIGDSARDDCKSMLICVSRAAPEESRLILDL